MLVKHTLHFLSDFFLDREYGGVFSAVDTLGQPIHCDDKQLIDQALAVLALTHQANGEIHTDSAKYLVAFEKLKDKTSPGYTELADRYWYPHPASQIRTMHIQLVTSLALIEAGHVLLDQTLFDAGLELFQICFQAGHANHFAEVLAPDWSQIFDDRPTLKSASLFAVIAARIAELRPEPASLEQLQLSLEHLYRFIDSEHGGLYERLAPNFQPLQREDKYLSSLSLAIIALVQAFQIYPTPELKSLALSLADFIQDHYYDPAFQGYWDRCSRTGKVHVDPVTSSLHGISPFPVKLAADHALLFLAAASLARVTEAPSVQKLAETAFYELTEFRDRRLGGVFQGQGNWWSSPIDPTVPLTRHFAVPPHTPAAFQSGNIAYVPFQVKQAGTQCLALLALNVPPIARLHLTTPQQDTPTSLSSLIRRPSYLLAESCEEACNFKIDIKKYTTWLYNTKVPGGAFGLTPYRSPLGLRADRSWQVFATVHVIADLKLLNLVIPEEEAVIQALQSCQNDDGGFGEQPGHPSDVFTTYCGVLALHLLNQTPRLLEQCIVYLQSCQNTDGGLGNFPGYRSDLWHTNLAVAALRALGTSPLDVDNCAAFVAECTNHDGAYSTRKGALPETFSAYRGIGTLYLLEKEIPLREKTIHWLQACQTKEGGFVYRPERVTSFVGTYHALAALFLLNELPLRTEACKQWLATHQNPDGGFSRPLGTPSATTDEGFISLHSAYMLDTNISLYWIAMIS
jgi:prenyltransferase beta subunit